MAGSRLKTTVAFVLIVVGFGCSFGLGLSSTLTCDWIAVETVNWVNLGECQVPKSSKEIKVHCSQYEAKVMAVIEPVPSE